MFFFGYKRIFAKLVRCTYSMYWLTNFYEHKKYRNTMIAQVEMFI